MIASLSGHSKLVHDTIEGFTALTGKSYDQISKGQHITDIGAKNALILKLMMMNFLSLKEIAEICGVSPEYCLGVKAHAQKEETPIRTTNYERLA